MLDSHFIVVFQFGLFIVYEPFRLSHQEDNTAGDLCSEFNSNLRRKDVV